jgi:DNA-binding GntR family transcriptional regulator
MVSPPATATREEVVDAVRRRILRAELVPGQRLVEAELCTLLGASRGTVRNALADLAHEGLIERIANRGARVRVVGLEEALYIADVRMVLEEFCVTRAAERVCKQDIAAFRDLARTLTHCAEQRDVTGFAEATHQTFSLYLRIAQQPVAEEILARLRGSNVRNSFRLTYRPGRAEIALPYWLAIIDAICAGDAERARAAVRSHSHNVQDTMRELAKEHVPFAIVYPGASEAPA